jgi:hypothetical protein
MGFGVSKISSKNGDDAKILSRAQCKARVNVMSVDDSSRLWNVFQVDVS